jgi:hypothetical protein
VTNKIKSEFQRHESQLTLEVAKILENVYCVTEVFFRSRSVKENDHISTSSSQSPTLFRLQRNPPTHNFWAQRFKDGRHEVINKPNTCTFNTSLPFCRKVNQHRCTRVQSRVRHENQSVPCVLTLSYKRKRMTI